MGVLERRRGWGWWETAALAGYAGVVATGIAWHEPWADEAQAWLMARDMGWRRLMLHGVGYEGSPGLWHSLLWVLIRLHVGYAGMHWVTGAIAAAGVAVFLRWAPFPLWLRLLLPFTFWIAYQDAVVARSYVLFTPLGFGAAALLRERARRPVLLGLLLGLIANISVHGFVVSLGLGAVAVVLHRSRGWTRRDTAGAAVAIALGLFAVATALPPADVNFSAGRNFAVSIHKAKQAVGLEKKGTGLKEETGPRPGELSPVKAVVLHRTRGQALWMRVGRLLSVITFPLSVFRVLGLLVFAALVLQGIENRRGAAAVGRVGLAPYLLMVAVFTSMYLAPRHAGMVFMAFAISLWLTWPEPGASAGRYPWLRNATSLVLLLAVLEQIGWTARCVWGDVHGPYASGAETAKFLREHAEGKRVAGFYYPTVGSLPYFDHNIYFNQIYSNQEPHSYWLWSREVRIDERARQAILTHPDYIVIGGFEFGGENGEISFPWVKPDPDLNKVPLADAFQILPLAEAYGYRVTHRFCGHNFMRDSYSELQCDTILEPAAESGGAP